MHHRLLVCLLLFAVASPACVRRRMTVRSNPPGATVYVDDQEIGATPVSTSFTYYGTRKIQLVKDGFETQTVKHKISTPWYQIPPFDFITENVLVHEIRDERIIDVELEPQRVVTPQELLSRAEQLRQQSQTESQAAQPAGYSNLPPPFPNPANAPPPFYPDTTTP